MAIQAQTDENKFRYVSNNKKSVSFNGKSIYCETALGIKGNIWSYSFDNSSVKYIKREGREEDLEVKFTSIEEAKHAIELFDYDCFNGVPGTLTVDDGTQQAYIIECKLDEQLNEYIKATLKIILVNGYWGKSKVFHLKDYPVVSISGLNYPTDYPHDYALRPFQNIKIDVESLTGVLVGLIFYSDCTNPYITISNNEFSNTYRVNDTCTSGERIVVNPYGKYKKGDSIYKIGNTGQITNVFSKREKGIKGSGSYIFERVPKGEHFVTWKDGLESDLYIYEEMGTPPWI